MPDRPTQFEMSERPVRINGRGKPRSDGSSLAIALPYPNVGEPDQRSVVTGSICSAASNSLTAFVSSPSCFSVLPLQ